MRKKMECFICSDSKPPLYRVCRCLNVIHKDCFCKLVNVDSHSTHCAICRQKYDIDVVEKTQIHIFVRYTCFFVFLACSLIGSINILIYFAPHTSNKLLTSFWYTFMIFIIILTILFIKYLLKNHYETENTIWCWYRTKIPLKKVIYLPQPLQTL